MDVLNNQTLKQLQEQWAGRLNKVSEKPKVTFFCTVSELIMELDPNHDGKITHEEFILIMKYIEQKSQQLPPIDQ